ncbi:MAG: ribosomal L7Ae/L30e/S12e/Gadd45 family protein [archaeon]
MEEEIGVLSEVKKNLKTKKLVYGSETTMKALKASKLSKVFIATNAPKNVADDLAHYQKLTGVQVVDAGMRNDELGVYCKKTFRVSIIGLLK